MMTIGTSGRRSGRTQFQEWDRQQIDPEHKSVPESMKYAYNCWLIEHSAGRSRPAGIIRTSPTPCRQAIISAVGQVQTHSTSNECNQEQL